MAEDKFRVLLHYANEVANSLLPISHNTIKARGMQLFHEVFESD